MVVVQVGLEIPDDIQKGIAKGILKMSGSIVRKSGSGEIVRHLKVVNLDKGKDSHVFNLKKVSEIASSINPKTKLIVGSSVIVVAATTGAYYAVKNFNKNKKTDNNIINSFNQTLLQYIDAAKNKRLTQKTIKNLEDSLKLVMDKNNGLDFNVVIDSQKITRLVDSIYQYTRNLAEKNIEEIQEIKRTDQDGTESNIIDLQKYLQVQKKIFEDVANA